MINVVAIVGPTATGKTGLAVDAAHALGSEIISVDSRQVYRGLDIGSGKDLAEYSRVDPPVPYHMIDIADPAEPYTVFHYQRDCYRVLAEAAEREPFKSGTPVVMEGGTGLYLEAVLRGFRIPDVTADPALREELMEMEHEELVERLRREDGDLAARTDTTSKKRVVRALEVALSSAKDLVSRPPPVELSSQVFIVDVGREELHRRIDERLERRLETGLVEEVAGLLKGGLPRERLLQLGLEYREVALYLGSEKSFDAMLEDLRYGIRRFAKRQQTWFRGLERRGLAVATVAPGDPDTILESISKT